MLTGLSRAFDSVNHEVILKKVNRLEINKHWLKDYLANRRQYVKLNNIISSSQSINHGVPQGSILGPILFSIHINDMISTISDSGPY